MYETRKRPPVFWKPGVVMAILIVAVLVNGCSTRLARQGEGETPASALLVVPSTNLPTNGLVQSGTGQAVTIDVKWLGEKKGLLTFDVEMNTHSVDLDSYDLSKLAVLRDDVGKEYSPVAWDSAPGGHHRSGTLTFPIPESISQGKPKYLEVLIRNIDGVGEQILKWEL